MKYRDIFILTVAIWTTGISIHLVGGSELWIFPIGAIIAGLYYLAMKKDDDNHDNNKPEAKDTRVFVDNKHGIL